MEITVVQKQTIARMREREREREREGERERKGQTTHRQSASFLPLFMTISD